MPYEFQGDNLVYVEPKEVAGYTWQPIAQNENGTNPEGQWVANEGFDPNSLIKGTTDKYGRVDYSPKENLTEAQKRAYALAWQGAGVNSPTLENNSVGNDWQIKSNLGWWDVDPNIQRQWEESNRRGSGPLGLTLKDYITPAAIIAAPFAIEAMVGEGLAGAAGAELAGPTYAELGYVPGAFTDAGLGYTGAASELGLEGSVSGLTDLSGAQGSALLESMGLNTSGMSAADVLKAVNNARTALGTANTIAKLASGTTGAKTGTTGSLDLSALANLLRPTAQTNDFLGQYKMNQNPFLFTSPGQSVASEGVYDVSGTNPMANALRKK